MLISLFIRKMCTVQEPTMLFPPNLQILKHDIKVFTPALNNYHLTCSF